MTAILAFLRMIPVQVWAVLAIVTALSGAHLYLVHSAVAENDKKWQAKEEAARVAHLAAVAALNAKYRKLESDNQAATDALGAQYAKDLATLKTQRDRDVANARAGALRLSIPSACPDRSTAAEALGTAAGSDGPKAGELPGEAGRTFLPAEITAGLYALADDANEVVAQLNLCQSIIRTDRALFGDRSP